MDQIGPMEALAIGVLLGYGVWLVVFFGSVRRRLMTAIGRRLRVRVREDNLSLAGGGYEPVGRGVPIAKVGAVWLADLLVVLLGTIGVAALVFVPLFLAAEGGLLDPVQAALTGRRVALALPVAAQMSAAQPTATLAVGVRNDGRNGERQCRLDLADYRAADGYLAGGSAFFDLPPGAERAVELPVRASRPPVGSHAVRVRVACAGRRLAMGTVALRVEP